MGSAFFRSPVVKTAAGQKNQKQQPLRRRILWSLACKFNSVLGMKSLRLPVGFFVNFASLVHLGVRDIFPSHHVAQQSPQDPAREPEVNMSILSTSSAAGTSLVQNEEQSFHN